MPYVPPGGGTDKKRKDGEPKPRNPRKEIVRGLARYMETSRYGGPNPYDDPVLVSGLRGMSPRSIRQAGENAKLPPQVTDFLVKVRKQDREREAAGSGLSPVAESILGAPESALNFTLKQASRPVGYTQSAWAEWSRQGEANPLQVGPVSLRLGVSDPKKIIEAGVEGFKGERHDTPVSIAMEAGKQRAAQGESTKSFGFLPGTNLEKGEALPGGTVGKIVYDVGGAAALDPLTILTFGTGSAARQGLIQARRVLGAERAAEIAAKGPTILSAEEKVRLGADVVNRLKGIRGGVGIRVPQPVKALKGGRILSDPKTIIPGKYLGSNVLKAANRKFGGSAAGATFNGLFVPRARVLQLEREGRLPVGTADEMANLAATARGTASSRHQANVSLLRRIAKDVRLDADEALEVSKALDTGDLSLLTENGRVAYDRLDEYRKAMSTRLREAELLPPEGATGAAGAGRARGLAERARRMAAEHEARIAGLRDEAEFVDVPSVQNPASGEFGPSVNPSTDVGLAKKLTRALERQKVLDRRAAVLDRAAAKMEEVTRGIADDVHFPHVPRISGSKPGPGVTVKMGPDDVAYIQRLISTLPLEEFADDFIPPVKPGFVRLYRGEMNGLPQSGEWRDAAGRWFTDNPDEAFNYASGDTVTMGGNSRPQMFYVDVPEDVARAARNNPEVLRAGERGHYVLPPEFATARQALGGRKPTVDEFMAVVRRQGNRAFNGLLQDEGAMPRLAGLLRTNQADAATDVKGIVFGRADTPSVQEGYATPGFARRRTGGSLEDELAGGRDLETNPFAAYATRSLEQERALAAREYTDGMLQITDVEGNALLSTADDAATRLNMDVGDLTDDFLKTHGMEKIDMPGLGDYVVDAAIAPEFRKMAKLVSSPEETKRLLKFLDQWMTLWKGYATVPLPFGVGFHMRNGMGNVMLNWLAGNVGMSDYMQAATLQRRISRGMREGDPLKYLSGETRVIAQEALRRGIVGSGGFIFEDLMYDSLRTFRSRGKKVMEATNPLDPNNLLIRSGRSVGKGIEENARLAHFIAKYREYGNFEDAALSTRRYLFDYGDLTRFEQEGMKRFIPFYTFTRKNTPLWVGAAFKQPGKYSRIQEWRNAFYDAAGRPYGEVTPGYIEQAGGVPLPFDINGNTAMFAPDLPPVAASEAVDPYFQALKEGSPADLALAPVKSFVNQSGGGAPGLVKSVIEAYLANKNFFSGRQFYPGEREALPSYLQGTPYALIGDQRIVDGEKQPTIDAKQKYVLEQLLPLLPKVESSGLLYQLPGVSRNATTDKDRELQRQISMFTGLQIKPLGRSTKRSELFRRAQLLMELLARLKSEGVDVPTTPTGKSSGGNGGYVPPGG